MIECDPRFQQLEVRPYALICQRKHHELPIQKLHLTEMLAANVAWYSMSMWHLDAHEAIPIRLLCDSIQCRILMISKVQIVNCGRRV